MQDSKHGEWMVMFYAPWCGHCKHMMPAWVELGTRLKNDNINVGRLDCTKFVFIWSPGDIESYKYNLLTCFLLYFNISEFFLFNDLVVWSYNKKVFYPSMNLIKKLQILIIYLTSLIYLNLIAFISFDGIILSITENKALYIRHLQVL